MTKSLTSLSPFHVLLSLVLCPLCRLLPGPLPPLLRRPASQGLIPGSELQATRLLQWSMVLPGSKLPGSLSPFFWRLGLFQCDERSLRSSSWWGFRDLPLEWLLSVGYGVCGVCRRIRSTGSRRRCTSCWPAFMESQPQPCSGRPLSDDLPPLDQVLVTRSLLRSSVPLGAKDLWSRCLKAALAGVIDHRDTRALA